MTVELRQLRYTVAAADYRSFRQAAEALRLKQSTLSRRIRQLEDRLNVVLFERSHAGVRPTEVGNEFLRTARRIIEEVDTMTLAATAVGRGESGRLSVGFYTSLSAGNLRATLVDFGKRFPDIDIRFVHNSRLQLLAAIRSRTIDVAIVTGLPASCGDSSRTMPLWSERIVVALPASHPLVSRQTLSWFDLKDETFLLPDNDLGEDFELLVLARLASPGNRPNIVKHEADVEVIKSLVGAGFGVGLLCDAYVGANHAGVTYREIRDPADPCRIGYTALWDPDNRNPALGRFINILRERYPPLLDNKD
jgi:DNA-binding transcriptional LysR family regulator